MKHRMQPRVRGYSLFEIAVSLALASIVGTVATMTLRSAANQVRRTEDRNLVDMEAKVVFEQLVYRLRGIGGNGLSPRAALWVQNRVDGTVDAYGNSLLAFALDEMPNIKPGTDSIAFVKPREDFPPCIVTSRVGGSQQLSVMGTQCCEEDAVLNEPILLVSTEGKLSARLMPVSKTCAGGGCHDGCALSMDATVANLSTVQAQLESTGESFAGAYLTLESTRVGFYVNTQNELMVVQESAASIERHMISDRVQDLQIAVGVDLTGDGLSAPPGAGLDATNDEWLWNATDAHVATLKEAPVRMLGFGIVMEGEHANELMTRRAQLLDGAEHVSSRYMRALYGQIGLRNQPEFQ